MKVYLKFRIKPITVEVFRKLQELILPRDIYFDGRGVCELWLDVPSFKIRDLVALINKIESWGGDLLEAGVDGKKMPLHGFWKKIAQKLKV